ncbi:conserved exported protein of unknown function [Endomicrobium proavitum]|uniref:Organic solvent tolerance-like N-terminal domain-containing protein n=1 Tax=Endomicrobium proavitum TaxID=1408281 RepID=A0A0G3WHY5_9BACT|nr:conserved exported protein of unknown function [Endomicrobium proavitum]
MLLRNKKSLSIKIISAAFAVLFLFVCNAAAQKISQQTVITGDSMEVRRSGDVTVSKGNSKAVNGNNVITSDNMIYNKKNSLLEASGRVKIVSVVNTKEPLEAYSSFAEYDINTEKGKLWGAKTNVKYFLSGSSAPVVLKAQEIYFNGGLETLSAFKDVEIITSSGTIFSDKAVYNKKDDTITMEKDGESLKRPTADIYYDGRKAFYEADKMIFHASSDSKKIIMTGGVSGKMEMEDKIQ